jgi:hypothetical protein
MSFPEFCADVLFQVLQVRVIIRPQNMRFKRGVIPQFEPQVRVGSRGCFREAEMPGIGRLVRLGISAGWTAYRNGLFSGGHVGLMQVNPVGALVAVYIQVQIQYDMVRRVLMVTADTLQYGLFRVRVRAHFRPVTAFGALYQYPLLKVVQAQVPVLKSFPVHSFIYAGFYISPGC